MIFKEMIPGTVEHNKLCKMQNKNMHKVVKEIVNIFKTYKTFHRCEKDEIDSTHNKEYKLFYSVCGKDLSVFYYYRFEIFYSKLQNHKNLEYLEVMRERFLKELSAAVSDKFITIIFTDLKITFDMFTGGELEVVYITKTPERNELKGWRWL